MRIFGYSGIWKSNNEDVVQGCRLELELWLRLFAQVRQCDCRIPAHASGMKRGKKSGWCAEPAQREAGAVKLADGWDLVCSHSPSDQARATTLFNNAKISLHYLACAKLHRYENQGIAESVGTRMEACQQQQDCEDLPVGPDGCFSGRNAHIPRSSSRSTLPSHSCLLEVCCRFVLESPPCA